MLANFIRESNIEGKEVRISDCIIRVLVYADGIILLVESKENLIEQVRQLLVTAKKVGLEINAEKTEYDSTEMKDG